MAKDNIPKFSGPKYRALYVKYKNPNVKLKIWETSNTAVFFATLWIALTCPPVQF